VLLRDHHPASERPPPSPAAAAGTIAGWVREMAAFVKGLDPNHLLTVGEEGFYSTTAAGVPSNPGYPDTDWATHWGQVGMWRCWGCSTNQSITITLLVDRQQI
jgi:endo-1,4-beta-mannosidase